MSRHLIIRCDAPGCPQQTETSASDTAPTSVDVPSGWLTLIAPNRPHKHYCSEVCLHASAPQDKPAEKPSEKPKPEPKASKK